MQASYCYFIKLNAAGVRLDSSFAAAGALPCARTLSHCIFGMHGPLGRESILKLIESTTSGRKHFRRWDRLRVSRSNGRFCQGTSSLGSLERTFYVCNVGGIGYSQGLMLSRRRRGFVKQCTIYFLIFKRGVNTVLGSR